MQFSSRIRHWSRSALIALGISSCAFTQTAEQLKTRFSALLGPNKFAKIVWQVEDANSRKPNFDYGGWPGTYSKIMAMDTKDGIVRTLIDFGNGHPSSPTFTWDGAKVCFTDNAVRKIGVIDWASGTKKDLATSFEGNGTCWQSTDGKQWYLAAEAKNSGILYRFNINNPTERVAVLTTTWNRVGYAGVTCWTSMSVDGKYCAGGWPNYGDLGWLDVTAKTVQEFSSQNGCWPTIARDNTYDVLHITSTNGHIDIRIVGRNGTEKLRESLRTKGVLTSEQWYETLRWTPDRNYVTLCAYGSNFNFRGIPNPLIVRLSDWQKVALVDNPSTAIGNMDVFFYGSTEVSRPAKAPQSRVTAASAAAGRIYDCRGRSVAARDLNSGVFLSAQAGHTQPAKPFFNLSNAL